MVKAYLRYVRQEAFGLVASPGGNVSFFSCPSSALSPSLSNDTLPLRASASAAAAVAETALQVQQQYVLTCSGAAVLLWHFAQQTPLLYFSPFPPPSIASSAAAATAASCPYHATRLTLSRGNRYLAVGYSDGSVRLWECPTAAALAAATSAASATAAACAVDSPAAAAAAAALYPPSLLTFHGHRSAVTTLAWGSVSEDALVGDTHLVSGAGDGDVIVWDRLLGAGVCRLHAHSAPVSALLLLSPSRAAAGEDGAAAGKQATAPAATERPTAAEDIEKERKGYNNKPLLLVSGGKDGLVKIWDVGLQLCLQTLVDAAAAGVPGTHALAAAGGRGEVWSLAVDSAQSRLLVGCADHVIRVYKLHHRVVRSAGSSEIDEVAREEEKEEQQTAAGANAAAASAAATSMGVSVDVVLGLPLFATFLGLIHRQAAGGGSSSGKRRTTCMQFVKLSHTPAGEAAGDASGISKREEDSLLIVCSGGSRSIEVYRMCGPRETRRRTRRRHRRQVEKLKKKSPQIKEQQQWYQQEKVADQKQVEEETICVTDQFVFLCRLHTKSVVKSFDARRRWRGWAAATTAEPPHLAETGGGGGEGKRRRKAEQRRQQHLRGLEQQRHHVAGQQQQQQQQGGSLEVDVILGLADNAVELWRVEAERFAEVVSRPTGSTSSSELASFVAGDGPAEKHQPRQQEAAAPAQLIRSLATAGHRGTVRHLSISHDSSLLLSLADEGLKVWTVHSRKCVKTLPLDFPLCGFFVAGNEHVLVGTRGGDLLLVNVGACGVQQQLAAHTNPVQALAEDPKHTGFCSVASDKTLKFFDFYVERTGSIALTASPSAAITRKQMKRARQNGSQLENAAIPRSGATAADPKATDVPEQEAETETSSAAGSSILFRQVGSTELPDAGVSVQYTMNGKYVACALQDMTILLLYADSKKLFLSLYGHQLPVYSISISSDSTLLASGSGDKTVKIWNVDFGNIQQSLLAHEQAVTQVLFLFQTHYLLSASVDAVVKLWDVDKRHCLVSVFSSVCNSPVTSLVATGDGDMVFAVHKSRLIQCWRRSQEQLFVEEEQQRRWEDAADKQALREDVLVGATAASTQVVLDRTTKRTIEALRSTERLMEVLDEAREQQELDTAHARALSMWEEQTLKSSTNGLPQPAPPPPKPELMGRTATEHVLRMLTALRSSDALEVLVALPFDYARRLLDFIVAHLSTYGALSAIMQQEQQQEDRRVLEAAASRRQAAPRSKEGAAFCGRKRVKEEGQEGEEEEQVDAEHAVNRLQIFLCPIETAARVAVILIQLHFKVFLASPSLRPLLASLRSCLRPLLLQERDRLRFNSAACAFVERRLALDHTSYSSAAYKDNASIRRIGG